MPFSYYAASLTASIKAIFFSRFAVAKARAIGKYRVLHAVGCDHCGTRLHPHRVKRVVFIQGSKRHLVQRFERGRVQFHSGFQQICRNRIQHFLNKAGTTLLQRVHGHLGNKHAPAIHKLASIILRS
jgi:hypothetical protein